ncbi:MAG: HD domain-containing protein [Parachlamydiales bacterium]|jgi:putative hydrolase of HD superfamily
MEKLNLVHLFQEIGMLSDTPRSGFAFLGSSQQSVAEHSYRMTMIAYYLAKWSKAPVNREKLLLLCLHHDFPEARTADHNYVNKRYLRVDESKLYGDYQNELPFSQEIIALLKEYDEGETIEAKIAHDADQLELLCVLKKEWDLGNKAAERWFNKVEQRLATAEAKDLATVLRTTSYDSWWQRLV